MESFASFELLLRGAAAGLCLFLSFQFLQHRRVPAASFGALFTFTMANYAIVSTSNSFGFLGPYVYPMAILATFGNVFFWWFSLALFNDDFKWRTIYLVPAAIVFALLIIRLTVEHNEIRTVTVILHTVLVYGLFGHVLTLAFRDWKGDLIASRRNFRFGIAILIPVIAVLVSFGEIADRWTTIPDWLILVHAFTLFSLALAFSIWGTLVHVEIFQNDRSSTLQLKKSSLSVSEMADQQELKKILSLMDDEIWREEGLSVGELGERTGIPEHRLRRLINQSLGHRNFTAFLNEYRLNAAEKALSDQSLIRRQITQIALDLGYGSVGTFNRAFKSRFDMTPTEFRQKILVDSKNR